MANSFLVLSFWDYDKENGVCRVPGAVPTEETFDAFNTEFDTLRAAINGVTLGVNWKEVRILEEVLISGTPPNDKAAQRELKWLVRMTEDGTFKHPTFTIPMADVDLLDEANKGRLDLSAGAGLALKNSVEATYVTENGHTVTVDEVVLVGRNT